MIDISVVAETVTNLIAPALPFLTSAAADAASDGAKALTKEVWQRARQVWAALGKDQQSAGDLERAARVLSAMPDDKDALAGLRAQVKMVLATNQELAAEIAGLVASGDSYQATLRGNGAIAQGPGAVAAGRGGVAVGGNVGGDITVR